MMHVSRSILGVACLLALSLGPARAVHADPPDNASHDGCRGRPAPPAVRAALAAAPHAETRRSWEARSART